MIDPTHGYAYFGGLDGRYGPGDVVKVRLSDFTQVGVLTLPVWGVCVCSAVIDTVNSYAYFGTAASPGVIVKVDLAELVLAQSADKGAANAGDVLTYTISVRNDYPDMVTGLMLTDTLPLSVTFVSVNPGPATCNDSAGQVICSLGTLAAGTSTEVTIQVKVIGGERGLIVNTASVSANEPRLNAPSTATLTTLINPLRRWLPWMAR